MLKSVIRLAMGLGILVGLIGTVQAETSSNPVPRLIGIDWVKEGQNIRIIGPLFDREFPEKIAPTGDYVSTTSTLYVQFERPGSSPPPPVPIVNFNVLADATGKLTRHHGERTWSPREFAERALGLPITGTETFRFTVPSLLPSAGVAPFYEIADSFDTKEHPLDLEPSVPQVTTFTLSKSGNEFTLVATVDHAFQKQTDVLADVSIAPDGQSPISIEERRFVFPQGETRAEVSISASDIAQVYLTASGRAIVGNEQLVVALKPTPTLYTIGVDVAPQSAALGVNPMPALVPEFSIVAVASAVTTADSKQNVQFTIKRSTPTESSVLLNLQLNDEEIIQFPFNPSDTDLLYGQPLTAFGITDPADGEHTATLKILSGDGYTVSKGSASTVVTLNRTAAPMLSISAEKVDGRHAVTVSANREIAGSDLDVAINVANTGAPDVPNNDLFTIPVDARFFTRTMSRTDFSGVLDAFTVTLSLTEHENYVIGDSAAVTLKFPSVRPISLTIAQKIKGDARRVGDFSATVGDVVVSLPVTDTQNFASAFSAPIPLVPGKPLTITSNPLATFTPTGAACTNGEYKTTEYELTKDARSFTFTPTLAGGNVGCVLFAEADKIAPKPTPLAPTVTLQTISNGGVATFTFSGAGAASFGPLSIQTTRKNQASSAAPIAANAGRLTVTQAKTPGFAYISAKCAVGDVDLGATVDKAGRKFAVDIPNTGAVACTVTNAGESASTVAVIRNFLRRRLESLTGDTAKSRLIERRNNAGENAVSGLKDALGVAGSGDDKTGRISGRTSFSQLDEGSNYKGGWDVWTEASWNYRRSDGDVKSDGQFGLVRGGVDYLVKPWLLVGVTAQYDYLSDKSDKHTISGHGWMVGPYVEVALTKNVVFDVKSLWGQSSNKVSPDLRIEDDFSTERWLASARLTGSWTWAQSQRSVWSFTPTAEVVWAGERSAGFVNSYGVDIAGQSAQLGRLRIGPEIAYQHTTSSGMRISPRVGAQLLWNFTGSDAAGGAEDVPFEDIQARFSGGLKFETPGGTRVDLEGTYTGLGSEGEETIGGKVGVTVPLQ